MTKKDFDEMLKYQKDLLIAMVGDEVVAAIPWGSSGDIGLTTGQMLERCDCIDLYEQVPEECKTSYNGADWETPEGFQFWESDVETLDKKEFLHRFGGVK